RFSPSDHVRKLSTLVHGSRDRRLSETDGMLLSTLCNSTCVRSRLVVFPDENHWTFGPRTQPRVTLRGLPLLQPIHWSLYTKF
ncbi:hypothetical protein BDM02DRAFT_3100642, partial [Thelephora ganbajun]